jgi:uncharacterized protein
MENSILVHVQPHFMIIPSNACNASCRYCFGPNKGAVISPEGLAANIRFIEKVVRRTGQPVVQITFHGGEPLMAPLNVWTEGLKLIKQTFKTSRLKLRIQSNLWNLTEEHCQLFSDYGVTFSTSLDGPEEINDLHRGHGYFSKTMKGINLLRKYQLNPGCIATFTPKNKDRIEQVFHFFVRNHLSFAVHASLPSINGTSGSFVLQPEDYGTLMCRLFDLYVPNRKLISISSMDQLCQSVAENCGKVCTFKDCSGSFLAFDPDGNIYPCQRFSGNGNYCLGSVNEEELINRLSSNNTINNLVQHYQETDRECGDCIHLPYCRGGCYYNSIASKTIRDPYCESYKMIFNKIRSTLLDEMAGDENMKEIIEKPYIGAGNPLIRKGRVIELTQKPHPVTRAKNAAGIISLVELSKAATLENAQQSLKNIGIETDLSYLQNLQDQCSSRQFRLNNCYIHVTFQCQLSCTHCYASTESAGDDAMTVPQILELLKQAKENGFRQAVITGGEPLMIMDREEFLNVMMNMRNHIEPMIVVLRTNFSMVLTDVQLEKIARAFHQVVVSVDGDKEYHEQRRGKGTYDLVTGNILRYQQVMQKSGKPAELSIACVMPAEDINSGAGLSVRSFAAKNHIHRIRFKPVLPIGKAGATFPHAVSEAVDSYADASDALLFRVKPLKTCGIGYNVYIEPNGNVFPCYAFHQPHSYIGNVFEEGIRNIISSEAFKDLFRHNVNTNIKCRNCMYRYLCGGACRAWGRDITQHDLDAAPPDCEGLYKKSADIYTAALNYLKSS